MYRVSIVKLWKRLRYCAANDPLTSRECDFFNHISFLGRANGRMTVERSEEEDLGQLLFTTNARQQRRTCFDFDRQVLHWNAINRNLNNPSLHTHIQSIRYSICTAQDEQTNFFACFSFYREKYIPWRVYRICVIIKEIPNFSCWCRREGYRWGWHPVVGCAALAVLSLFGKGRADRQLGRRFEIDDGVSDGKSPLRYPQHVRSSAAATTAGEIDFAVSPPLAMRHT